MSASTSFSAPVPTPTPPPVRAVTFTTPCVCGALVLWTSVKHLTEVGEVACTTPTCVCGPDRIDERTER